MPDFKLLSECLNSLERGVLLEVFIVERTPGSSSGAADQQSDFTGIDIHVTNLRRARLYVT